MATRPPTGTGFDPLVLVPGLMCAMPLFLVGLLVPV